MFSVITHAFGVVGLGQKFSTVLRVLWAIVAAAFAFLFFYDFVRQGDHGALWAGIGLAALSVGALVTAVCYWFGSGGVPLDLFRAWKERDRALVEQADNAQGVSERAARFVETAGLVVLLPLIVVAKPAHWAIIALNYAIVIAIAVCHPVVTILAVAAGFYVASKVLVIRYTKLAVQAKAEGRTDEWVAEQALQSYLTKTN